MTVEPLRVTQAARRLGMTTRELLELIKARRIRYVMIDGIAHVPEDAVAEYKSRAS